MKLSTLEIDWGPCPQTLGKKLSGRRSSFSVTGLPENVLDNPNCWGDMLKWPLRLQKT